MRICRSAIRLASIYHVTDQWIFWTVRASPYFVVPHLSLSSVKHHRSLLSFDILTQTHVYLRSIPKSTPARGHAYAHPFFSFSHFTVSMPICARCLIPPSFTHSESHLETVSKCPRHSWVFLRRYWSPLAASGCDRQPSFQQMTAAS